MLSFRSDSLSRKPADSLSCDKELTELLPSLNIVSLSVSTFTFLVFKISVVIWFVILLLLLLFVICYVSLNLERYVLKPLFCVPLPPSQSLSATCCSVSVAWIFAALLSVS